MFFFAGNGGGVCESLIGVVGVGGGVGGGVATVVRTTRRGDAMFAAMSVNFKMRFFPSFSFQNYLHQQLSIQLKSTSVLHKPMLDVANNQQTKVIVHQPVHDVNCFFYVFICLNKTMFTKSFSI